MKHRTIGCVVLLGSKPMVLDDSYVDDPKGGVLRFGNVATVFPTRQSAQSAIKKTLRRWSEMGLPPENESLKIHRVGMIVDW